MICFPNAKINLGLNIVSKRSDGYHNIETIFYPVGIKDALEIVPAKGKKGIFRLSGIPIDGSSEDNLIIKAYRLLQKYHTIPEIDIYLQKNIPFGAGLGGGSANAASMLLMCNEFANLGLNIEQLEALAAELGADCPFFIKNKPVYAAGIGAMFTSINLNLSAYQLILVRPKIHISTKEAYARVVPRQPLKSLLEIIQLPLCRWRELMVNDFEKSIFTQYPEIAEIKENLYRLGAIYASMSGSGSAVYGIFENKFTEIVLSHPYTEINLG